MTAMMTQYMEIKEQNPGCLLLFRLGDFYEMFFDDAIIASKDLDIALTGRNYGEADRAPMCGVPYHAADGYIARLVEKGHRVAICEQMESPKPGQKGPVKRDVVRIVTPGTILDAQMLDAGKNNYIVCIHRTAKGCALAAADVSTGAFMVRHFSSKDGDDKAILDEISRYQPSEILINQEFIDEENSIESIEEAFAIKPIILPAWTFGRDFTFKCLCEHFGTIHLEAFGLNETDPEISASGALLSYLQDTQKGMLSQITTLRPLTSEKFLILDRNTRANLELTAPMRPWRRGNQKQTLLAVLDRTCTAMGARLLRSWVENPLIKPSKIEKRLDCVEEWAGNAFLRAELRDSLKLMHDIERVMGRIAGRNANSRDMLALRASLTQLPYVKEKLWECKAALNVSMQRNFDDMADLQDLLRKALKSEQPLTIREGGIFKLGYNQELDDLLNIKENGNAWLAELEARERDETGIKNLKLKYNKVFGYYIDITKSNLNSVPDNYVRKQTLANSERFTTDELDKLAENILQADEKRVELELALFEDLRQEIIRNMERIQYMASLIASLDALQSLGDTADRNRYCKPVVNDSETIYIKAGRHPVLDQFSSFVPNDCHLNGSDRRLALITGPNMAGKSTYMRQVALITLMAQIGSFVPADEAHIGVVDRIFTRVGASDDLAGGQSTFMVEMTEVAHILHNATRNSLIVMDEIGRGTSTFDGLSIAWAVLEYIASQEMIGAKTLFATHYHELVHMEERIDGVRNYSFTLGEGKDGSITFTRKLIRGGADRSFGIQVARFAGLPPMVVRRAGRVLESLERTNSFINTNDIEPPHAVFFSEDNYLQQGLEDN